jgi:rSAM/selenodomain-associated transferase 2
MRTSVIVPTLDEAARLSSVLAPLRAQLDSGDELIVVDGGSRDASVDEAARFADRVVSVGAGRARQMNAGVCAAGGDWLWFVHADTVVDAGALGRLRAAVGRRPVQWGRFDVRLSGPHAMLRVVAAMMNARSRCTGIATGDQAIFVAREAFDAVGGFPDQPLLEDVALSRRLRARQWPLCLSAGVTTSSRRWEDNGIGRTITLMWRLRWAYWRGGDPAELARRYRGDPV